MTLTWPREPGCPYRNKREVAVSPARPKCFFIFGWMLTKRGGHLCSDIQLDLFRLDGSVERLTVMVRGTIDWLSPKLFKFHPKVGG
jgi:hypothetical protein